MLQGTFEHDQIRKYTVIIGALFDNLYVNRHDTANNVIQKIKVPLTYGPKDKILARLFANPDATNQIAVTIPRMAFELTGLNYDPDRKMQNMRRIIAQDTADNTIKATYNPVPYNLAYTVYMACKTQTDGLRLIEQIIPTFKPQYTVEAEVIKELGIVHDIPIILDSIAVDDTYEGKFEDMRHVIWTLKLTLKGYMYDIVTPSGIIKFIEARFPNQSVETTIQPGLTANGQPTTDITQTIPYASILKDDDWAVIIDLEEPYNVI